MINHVQIARLLEAREYRQLIDRILANGRCRSVMARRMLADPHVARICAMGLGLQRICEITYRPEPMCGSIAAQLVALQDSEGFLWDADEAPSASISARLVCTAVGIRALIAGASQIRSAGFDAPVAWARAIDSGIDAIAAAANDEPSAHPAAWAIVLWQLGDCAEFRRRVELSTLLEMLDGNAPEMVQDDLCRYAHAMAA